ncbi:MAG: Receptor family ligand binding region [Candidatus Scalindua rubra]|uniref:Receptor family ligand binding region n=1 Tax=Candidatus Scalindua rubra TaxID=1872076 RepID=A0A1E3XBD3_9BACT|nr:MAG: Receptor family ligand binding region [Candidatus Scalindua rubra]
MQIRIMEIVLAVLIFSLTPFARADPEDSSLENAIHFYLDADQTGVRASGQSIRQGILTALSEVDNTIQGYQIKLVIKDHHGSSPRSKQNLLEYLADSRALVVFSGLHSPPLLSNLRFINESHILVLDPWAAAAPITRYSNGLNWIFRLSIDDSKAGFVIADHAIKVDGFRKLFLLLEQTGWGKSNYITMTSALKQLDCPAVGVKWFNWNIGLNAAKNIIRKIKSSGADCILLVANAPEGKIFAKAMIALDKDERLPIRSHWGITGGNFPLVIDSRMRSEIDLKFIQTSFSFINTGKNVHNEHPIAKQVLEIAMRLFPEEIQKASDIKAPTGFIHAYDLTKLLISAMSQVKLSGNIKKDRAAVRTSLENIKGPIQGLIKAYSMPFSEYSKQNEDAHEALNISDYKMAVYGLDNEILLVEDR